MGGRGNIFLPLYFAASPSRMYRFICAKKTLVTGVVAITMLTSQILANVKVSIRVRFRMVKWPFGPK